MLAGKLVAHDEKIDRKDRQKRLTLGSYLTSGSCLTGGSYLIDQINCIGSEGDAISRIHRQYMALDLGGEDGQNKVKSSGPLANFHSCTQRGSTYRKEAVWKVIKKHASNKFDFPPAARGF